MPGVQMAIGVVMLSSRDSDSRAVTSMALPFIVVMIAWSRSRHRCSVRLEENQAYTLSPHSHKILPPISPFSLVGVLSFVCEYVRTCAFFRTYSRRRSAGTIVVLGRLLHPSRQAHLSRSRVPSVGRSRRIQRIQRIWS